MLAPLILALALSPAADPVNKGLPAEWHGRWTGTLKIAPVAGEPQELPMELTIEPIKDGKALRWKIIYGEGKKAPIRDYELIPQEKANHFVIDEKNGLLIDAWLVGDTLHSQFQVQDSLLTVRYVRSGDTLQFNIMAYTTKEARTSKLTKGEMEVKANRLQSVHRAELRLAKP